ncbi:ABC transporter substrate-binding protein [Devosia sp. FJ2-5-3]|uniref:ABC transporter substrate-binding protein n=1 Tax=Devosia sp. FJ2-5-3 TaxID=2976680 RepID=UPI0023D80816|nr:ABC transporter substrate-binding protein [Devosia sp. FJ2-5-3]WEJ60130.1 ABC transporter substrate-binding protein [Devosia sp. FJ2-5-3]
MQRVRIAALAGISLFALATSAMAQDYKQAPELDALVSSGALPAVAERVGANPRVLTPVESVGKYGGTFRGGMVGGNDRNMLFTYFGYEGLLAWDADWTGEVHPNIATGYTASADSRSFTFTLREGMKWSDGSPFTADDVAFFIEDILPDEKLFPTKPGWLTVEGELPSIAVISPTEFTMSWSKPNGLFILNAASVYGVQLALLNKAYCSQFLPKYNENADAEAVAAGAAGWAEHMVAKCGVGIEAIERWRNPERPVLEAWKIVDPYVAGATRVTFERNPYYWKVDTDGNQLPYIDDLSIGVNAESQTLLLSVLAGEIDYEVRHTTNTTNLPVIAEGVEQGDYRISPRESRVGNVMTISVNLNSQDATKAPIFQNKDFRIALSHALDRQAIIDTIYLGQSTPQQVSPREGTPYYNERLATQYLEHDVEKANALLDSIGLDKRGGNGMRLAPDGSPLVVNVAAVTALGNMADAAELFVQYWQAVGVDARFTAMDRTRFYEEKTASQHDIVVWGATSGGIDVFIDPRDYFPFSTESNFAIEWAKNYIGDGGVEPPDYVKEQWALYDQIKATSVPEEQNELFQRLLEITADQFYQIGIGTAVPLYSIAKNNLGNVPDGTPTGWIHPDPGTLNTEQFYFK